MPYEDQSSSNSIIACQNSSPGTYLFHIQVEGKKSKERSKYYSPHEICDKCSQAEG